MGYGFIPAAGVAREEGVEAPVTGIAGPAAGPELSWAAKAVGRAAESAKKERRERGWGFMLNRLATCRTGGKPSS